MIDEKRKNQIIFESKISRIKRYNVFLYEWININVLLLHS